MAKYYADDTLHFDTFSIRRDEHEIHINRVPAVSIHRELCDLFDEIDWIVDVQPTTRINDNLIQVKHPWKVVNPEDATKGTIYMYEDAA